MVTNRNAEIIVLMLVCCSCIALCASPTEVNQHQDRVSTPTGTPPLTSQPGSGQPCTSNEAWHTKADEIGFWSGGILVEQSMTDEEIFTMLARHNLPNQEEVKISAPHHIGYYLSINETRDRALLNDLRTSHSRWNVSFSSPETGFFPPTTKARGDSVEIPVFLSYSVRMKEPLLSENILDRGVPLRKAKVVELGYFSSRDVAGKERILHELNTDPRVLFAFKEYLQGDIC